MEPFHQLIQSTQPVLVDFYADWCGPCKAMQPTIQEVAHQVQGKARVIKINVDKNPHTAMQYQIQAIPTFIIFQNGQIKWRHTGMVDRQTLLNQLLSLSQVSSS
ncbi:MAG: thioredoxin [Thermoflavifilum sp.]|nr:thioredoxin [Thermoflavifilum sp.]